MLDSSGGTLQNQNKSRGQDKRPSQERYLIALSWHKSTYLYAYKWQTSCDANKTSHSRPYKDVSGKRGHSIECKGRKHGHALFLFLASNHESTIFQSCTFHMQSDCWDERSYKFVKVYPCWNPVPQIHYFSVHSCMRVVQYFLAEIQQLGSDWHVLYAHFFREDNPVLGSGIVGRAYQRQVSRLSPGLISQLSRQDKPITKGDKAYMEVSFSISESHVLRFGWNVSTQKFDEVLSPFWAPNTVACKVIVKRR